MGFMSIAVLLVVLIVAVSWLNRILLARLFPQYQAQLVKRVYRLITLATILTIGYGWARRPFLMIPEHEAYQYLVYAAVVWIVGQVILLVLLPLFFMVRRLMRRKESSTASNPDSSASTLTRRSFLRNTAALTPLVAFGMSTRGVYEAQAVMTVQKYALTFPDLPPNLEGFKIGQISDVHLGPYFDLTKLDLAIQQLADEKPDLVAITGDFADDLSLFTPALARLNEFQMTLPYGIYFCYGNHDYFRNFEFVRSELHKSRIVPLENNSALIIPGPKPFYLLGVDYPWPDAAHSGVRVSESKRHEFFAAANQTVPADGFKVLIAHHPDFLFDAFAAQIPLTLTGHTHGGQVKLFGKSIISNYTYMSGMYQENGVYGYVSNGTGHWFPFRFNCPPEVGLFTLRR